MLSFILPAYKSADVVGETVASILAQDLDEPFEIVAVEDGSPDDTADVLETLRVAHGDVLRVHRHDTNRGEGAARNTAIRHAIGDLLYIVDADNLLPAGLVRRLVGEQRRTGAHAVSVSRLSFFDGDPTSPTGTSPVVAREDGWSSLEELLTTWQVPASHGNYLVTRELYDTAGGYPEGLTMSAWAFGLRHLVRGYDVLVVPDTFYLHRVGHEGNWLRGQRLGINDRIMLEAIREEADRLPADVADRVRRLRDGDPFAAYLEAGHLRPGGSLPTAIRRYVTRKRLQAGRLAGRLSPARPA